MAAMPLDFRLRDEHVYDGMPFPGHFQASTLDQIKEFQFQDDVILISYPKAGMTWLQEMVWIIMHDGDIEAAKQQDVRLRVPFLEQKDFVSGQRYLDIIERGPRPAVVKSHLPADFFRGALRDGQRARFVILVRNPKDNLVSFYHFYRSSLMGSFPGSWDDFFQMARERRLMYQDMFHINDSWLRISEESEDATKGRILWVKYEDMHLDLKAELRRIAQFLGKADKLSEEKLTDIAHHGSFTSMRGNKMTNYLNYKVADSKSPFLRAGRVGEWKDYFSNEQNAYVDDMYQRTYCSRGMLLEFQ